LQFLLKRSVSVRERRLKSAAPRWHYDTKIELGADLTEAINSMQLDLIKGFARKKLPLVGYLNVCSAVFAHSDETDRIIRAGRWLFDSSLEILLGDRGNSSNELRLSELLGNRCAYLVGETRTARDEIMADFKKIYEVRSRIVHSGHSRLSNKDRELFYKLRGLCGAAISREIQFVDKEHGTVARIAKVLAQVPKLT
jgi:hypothetical protein